MRADQHGLFLQELGPVPLSSFLAALVRKELLHLHFEHLVLKVSLLLLCLQSGFPGPYGLEAEPCGVHACMARKAARVCLALWDRTLESVRCSDWVLGPVSC